ncbi:hypothetical protein FISHEDRAFT_67910 [Fistulina hepatica ATCC 64428]|nr:hypothetical protein FISHEDRAFT_67910 [Fistulina hepatica ATCC 64428]
MQTVTRQRLLILTCGEMETVKPELEAVARNWVKPPPDALFYLRTPSDNISFSAQALITGPYVFIAIQLDSEDTFQIISHNVPALRVEICGDGPPPVEEPPPPPVLEMPGIFTLELVPGQSAELETTITSDEMDMARMDDGSTVDGVFWGKLDIVHAGDVHKMEFTGTRMVDQEYNPALIIDQRVMQRLTDAAKPPSAKCTLQISSPTDQYCDVYLNFTKYWTLENLGEGGRVKYFVRAHPGGALEHFESGNVVTALYYEAIPDPDLIEPENFISPHNGFAMPFRDFIPHLMHCLDQLGFSPHARTHFVNNNISAFAAHKNIAYRFMPPDRIAAAIDISVTAENCIFLRIFLIFRGLTDEEMDLFAGAGEREASLMNWREVVGWSEESKDTTMFRLLETSVFEVS